MGLVVQKYGGSSVGTAERIKRVAERIVATRKDGNEVVVVVSAMGDTTDELLDLAQQVCPAPPPGCNWVGSTASINCWIGLAPRKAANSVPTGGVSEIVCAAAVFTPSEVRPLYIADRSELASPIAIREKKPPIDSTMPAFIPVARTPDAAPRWSGGTEFMLSLIHI